MKKVIAISIALFMLMSGVFGIIEESRGSISGSLALSQPGVSPFLTSRTPIRINSDTELASGGFNGSGTLLDPYVIENYRIDGNSYGYGIYIGNTTLFFVVRNCTVSNASGVGSDPYFPNANIVLYNVRNGLVYNNTIYSATDSGIYLYASSNNIIAANNVSGNEDGIKLQYSSNYNRIENNNASANNYKGIFLNYWNTGNVIEGNNASSNNGHDGITIYRSNDTRIINSTLLNNGRDGIILSYSNNTTIESAIVSHNNQYGIYLESSGNTTLNNISSLENSNYEFYAYYSDHITITDSSFTGISSAWAAIVYLDSSSNFSMIDTDVSHGYSRLIVVYYGENIVFDGCTVHNSTTDFMMRIYYARSVTISNNTLYSAYQGIYCTGWEMDIYNNTISGIQAHSIWAAYNYNTWTRIRDNTITGSYVGIYMQAQNAVIRNNTMLGTGIFMNTWDPDDVIIENTVNGKPVYYAYNVDYQTVPAGMGQILLYSCDHFVIDGQNLSDGTVGIQIYAGRYGRISNNTMENNHLYGLWMRSHYYGNIANNTVSNSTQYETYAAGMWLQYSDSNTFEDNYLEDSKFGIYLGSGSNRNIFRDNTMLRNGLLAYEWNTLVADNDIDLSNTVNGLPLYFLGGVENFTVPAYSAGQVVIVDSRNISVGAQNIHNSSVGMEIIYSDNVSASDISIRDESFDGILVNYGSHIGISGSSIRGTGRDGLQIYRTDNFTMDGTSIKNASNYGANIGYASHTEISGGSIQGTESYGAYIYRTDNFTMDGTSIRDVNPDVYGGLHLQYLRDFSVSNCVFYNASRRAIYDYYSTNGEIYGCDIQVPDSRDGIFLYSDRGYSGMTIRNNTIRPMPGAISIYYGIYIYGHNDTELYGNQISRAGYSMYIHSCYDLDIWENTFVDNGYGIYIYRSSSFEPYIPSRVYHNNFIDSWWGDIRLSGAYNDSLNLSYPGGGNYYSGYNGLDYFSGPNQDMTGPDGMGDTANPATSNGVDYYPLIFPYGSIPTSLANSSWPMFGHDMKHTGMTDVNGPPVSVEYWNYSTTGSVPSSPVVGSDGSVYFTSFDGGVYALNTDGSAKWTLDIGTNIQTSTALAEDGTMYISAMNGTLYALYSSNGTEKWNYSTGNAPARGGSPVIGTDGTIYVVIQREVYAINDDGSFRWSYNIGGPLDEPSLSPAIGTDGMIYVSTYLNYTYAFYPDNGTLKWSYDIHGNISAAPVVMQDSGSDTAIIGTYSGNVSAIAENGTFMGGMDFNGSINGLSLEGTTLYIATGSGKLYALDTLSGTILWNFSASGGISGSVSIDKNGNIYFGTVDGTIYALDPSGNQIWNYSASYPLRTSPAIAPGLLLLGGDGGVYCMGDVTDPSISITFPADGQIIESDSVTVLWTGSDAESGVDHYEVKLDSGTWTSVGTSTQHTFSGLSEGEHAVYVRVFDNAGNQAMDTVNFTTDTYSPVINITEPANDSLIAVNHTSVVWTGSDNGTGIDHYEVRIDNGTWINVGTNTSYEFSSLADGVYVVDVRAFDGSGKNATGSTNFTIDTAPPELSISSPSDGQIFTSTGITVTWNGSDAISGIEHYEIMLDTDTPINMGTNTSYELTNLGEGEHTVSVRVVDRAGNENTSSVRFFIDTAPPEITITAPSEGSLHTASVQVTWYGSDSGSGIAYYLVRLDGGMWINTGMNTSHTYTGLLDGEHTVDVRATDRAGLLNLTSVGFTVDGTAPELVSVVPQDNAAGVNVSATIVIHFSEPIDTSSFVFSCSPNPDGWSLLWSVNNTVLTMQHDDFEYATTYVLRFNASDDAGNQMSTYTLPFTTTDMGTITGRVVDENGNPIAGATIILDGSELSETTDANGEFSVQVHAGAHNLTVSKGGYEKRGVNVSVIPGETTEIQQPIELPKSKAQTTEGLPLAYLMIIVLLIVLIGAGVIAIRRKRIPAATGEREELPEETEAKSEKEADEFGEPEEYAAGEETEALTEEDME